MHDFKHVWEEVRQPPPPPEWMSKYATEETLRWQTDLLKFYRAIFEWGTTGRCIVYVASSTQKFSPR